MYVMIVGPDGAGKTSLVDEILGRQIRGSVDFSGPNLLDSLIREFGSVTFSSEPTKGEYGVRARQMLRGEIPFDEEALLELFVKDREENMREIEALLGQGNLVIQDRGKYCNAAYQGRDEAHARSILELNGAFRDPDLVLYMNLPAETCLERIQARAKSEDVPLEKFDRIEKIRKVKELYEAILPKDRTVYVNAEQSPETIARFVVDVVLKAYKEK